MILPTTYREDMTDAELVAAYLAEGCNDDEARAYMNALRHPAPGEIYD